MEGEVPRYFFRNLKTFPGIDFLQKDTHGRRMEKWGVAIPIILIFTVMMFCTPSLQENEMGARAKIWLGLSVMCVIGGCLVSRKGFKMKQESRACNKALDLLESSLHQANVDTTSLHPASTDDEVRNWADEALTLLAQEILVLQAQELPASREQTRMSQVATTLWQFGLGQGWGVYFKAAKSRINPYTHFNWQI